MINIDYDILGLKKRDEIEIQEEKDVRMRSKYFDPIENFPDKVDQLLEALNQVLYYLFSIKFLSLSFFYLALY